MFLEDVIDNCQIPSRKLRFRQDATVGAEHRIAAFRQRLALDKRLASGAKVRNRATWTVFDLVNSPHDGLHHLVDDHYICDSSRSCDPTKPECGPHHVNGTKET